MNKEDAHIVIAMANHNMNVTDVARAIFAHRNTVLYHLDKVKRQSGLDPRRFYDLVELVKMAQVIYALSDFLIMIVSWLVKQSLRAFLFQEVQL